MRSSEFGSICRYAMSPSTTKTMPSRARPNEFGGNGYPLLHADAVVIVIKLVKVTTVEVVNSQYGGNNDFCDSGMLILQANRGVCTV